MLPLKTRDFSDTVYVLEADRCDVRDNGVTTGEKALDFDSGEIRGSLRPDLSQLLSLFQDRVVECGLVVQERSPRHSPAE